MTNPGRVLTVLLLTSAALVIYAHGLDFSPASLHPDEVGLSLQARSIAQTVHDVDGRFLPLYFHIRDMVWAQPLPVYFTALFLTAMGLSEFTVRLPTVILAAVDVALIYAIAKRLFGGDLLAAIASGLLILTPSFFIHSRLALSCAYPIPFILAWLLCVIAFVQRRRPWLLSAATMCLGFGFYSDPSAVLMMPTYFALTLLAVWLLRGSTPLYAGASAGFLVPLLILIPWFGWLPVTFRYTLDAWGLHGFAHPGDGLRYSILDWHTVGSRAGLYWGFFSPSYLFFTGGDNLTSSTRHAGVFLGLTAILLTCGVYHVVKSHSRDPIWRVVLLGFVLAPLSAITFNEPRAIARELNVLPFGILISVAGVEFLLSARRPAMRLTAVCVLGLMPIQFYRFYDDYFTQYRLRSSIAFGRSTRGALTRLIELAPRGPTPRVFLSTDLPHITSLWSFYLAKQQREDLRPATTYFDPATFDPRAIPPGAIVLTGAGSDTEKTMVTGGVGRTLDTIVEPDGSPSFAILERAVRE